jgi:hypothetical protein
LSGTEGIRAVNRKLVGRRLVCFYLYEIGAAKEAREWLKIVEEIS